MASVNTTDHNPLVTDDNMNNSSKHTGFTTSVTSSYSMTTHQNINQNTTDTQTSSSTHVLSTLFTPTATFHDGELKIYKTSTADKDMGTDTGQEWTLTPYDNTSYAYVPEPDGDADDIFQELLPYIKYGGGTLLLIFILIIFIVIISSCRRNRKTRRAKKMSKLSPRSHPSRVYQEWIRKHSNDGMEDRNQSPNIATFIRERSRENLNSSPAGGRRSVLVEGRHSNVYHKLVPPSGANMYHSSDLRPKCNTLPALGIPDGRDFNTCVPMYVNAPSENSLSDEDSEEYSDVHFGKTFTYPRVNQKRISVHRPPAEGAQRVDVIRGSLGDIYVDKELLQDEQDTCICDDYVNANGLARNGTDADELDFPEAIQMYVNAPAPDVPMEVNHKTYMNTYMSMDSINPLAKKSSSHDKLTSKSSGRKKGVKNTSDPLYLVVLE